MKTSYKGPLKALIDEFNKMPGIGPRTAERLAFYILKTSAENGKALLAAITRVKETVRFCALCNNLSETETCEICNDPSRDRSIICVVEEPKEVIAIEKTGAFNGVYHVLLGTLSPLDGIGPADLKIEELIGRIKKGGVKEIIVATSFDTEGETTALYLARLLKPRGVKVSRVAYGIPVGSSIEYADQATVAKALDGRRDI